MIVICKSLYKYLIWFVAKDRFDLIYLDTFRIWFRFDLRSFAIDFDLISNQKILICHSSASNYVERQCHCTHLANICFNIKSYLLYEWTTTNPITIGVIYHMQLFTYCLHVLSYHIVSYEIAHCCHSILLHACFTYFLFC